MEEINKIIFDDKNENYEMNENLNHYFLITTEHYINDLMRSRLIRDPSGRIIRRGYVYLNEVRTCLGLKKIKSGDLVGWVYDPEHPVGDNFVDFGLSNVKSFKSPIELEMNHDGDIFNYIY